MVKVSNKGKGNGKAERSRRSEEYLWEPLALADQLIVQGVLAITH